MATYLVIYHDNQDLLFAMAKCVIAKECHSLSWQILYICHTWQNTEQAKTQNEGTLLDGMAVSFYAGRRQLLSLGLFHLIAIEMPVNGPPKMFSILLDTTVTNDILRNQSIHEEKSGNITVNLRFKGEHAGQAGLNIGQSVQVLVKLKREVQAQRIK